MLVRQFNAGYIQHILKAARRKANAGSFIRPAAPGISLGQSFLTALSSKYVEEIHGSTEKLILGSSNGAIEVEAVNLDLIRGNLSRLETLREVSLEDVASADPAGDVRKKSPGKHAMPSTPLSS